MKTGLQKRLQSLEADSAHICPQCMRIGAMTEEELDAELARLVAIAQRSVKK
jgi:hypothetical protein